MRRKERFQTNCVITNGGHPEERLPFSNETKKIAEDAREKISPADLKKLKEVYRGVGPILEDLAVLKKWAGAREKDTRAVPVFPNNNLPPSKHNAIDAIFSRSDLDSNEEPLAFDADLFDIHPPTSEEK